VEIEYIIKENESVEGMVLQTDQAIARLQEAIIQRDEAKRLKKMKVRY